MHKGFRLLSAFTASVILAACSHAASTVSITDTAAHVRAAVSPGVAGELNVIQIQSDSVVPNGVEVDMPDMAMRPEPYALTKTGKDVYEARGVRFSMAGTWRITVIGAPGQARIGSFNIIVK